jgi:hypothetical protein
MNNKYSNLPNSKVYFYRALLFCFIIDIGIFIFALYQNNLNIAIKVMAGVSIWSLCVYIIPLIYIHFNYYIENKNSILKLTENGISISRKNDLVVFEFNEIKKVEFNFSYTLYDKRFRWFFWDEYFYAEVHLKNGENLIITCLLFDQLETIIPLKLIKRKKRIFPYIKKLNVSTIEKNTKIQTGKRIKNLTLSFKKKSKSELSEIINNKNKYQKEAIEIANQILKEKNVG